MPYGRRSIAVWQALTWVFLAVSTLGGCGETAPDTANPAVQTQSALPVRVLTAAPSAASRSVSAVGTVRYRRETPLGFTTAGRVAQVRFNVGDAVSKGTLLAALDATTVQGDLSAARAEAGRADAELSRIATLYDQGWVTKGRLEQTQAGAEAARARVSQAGFATDTARIYAPSSGVVLSRAVDPGQVVAAGMPALVVGQNDGGLVLRAPFAASDAARLAAGLTGTVSLSGVDGTLTGKLTEIEGRADDATGSVIAVFALPANARIRSGQIGTVTLTLPAETGDAGIAVPPSALFDVRAGEGLVFVVDTASMTAQPRSVTIGKLSGGAVTISGGVARGDRIVVTGGERLRAGAKVRIVGPGAKTVLAPRSGPVRPSPGQAGPRQTPAAEHTGR